MKKGKIVNKKDIIIYLILVSPFTISAKYKLPLVANIANLFLSLLYIR